MSYILEVSLRMIPVLKIHDKILRPNAHRMRNILQVPLLLPLLVAIMLLRVAPAVLGRGPVALLI